MTKPPSASLGDGHVVVACDKFKGSLSAAEVAATITEALELAVPNRPVRSVLVADGGEGTLAAAESVGFIHVPVTVNGPTGEPNPSGYAVRDGVAVLELADACGLAHLPSGHPAPLTASSRGLGEVLVAALHNPQVREVIMGVGGSASTDGGAGLLAALGAGLFDAAGAPLPDGGAALADLATLDLTGLHPRLAQVPITLACDVTNPLLGEHGTVAVFAEQKGAGPPERERLEAALTRYAQVVTAVLGRDDTGRPGAGAAGGVGYAALAALGARMRPGIDVVLDVIDFESVCAGAALVITGEGSLDRQTLFGKTPAGVARAARARGIPVLAVCGRAELAAADLAAAGFEAVYALTDLEPDPDRCLAQAGPLLRRLVARVARDWLAG